MSLDNDILLLSRVALFEGFEEEHLRLLAFGADKRSFKKGAKLFAKGAYADGGYVIISGTVDITADSEEYAEKLASYGSGSLIGELAMISENNRTVTATARDQVETFKITRLLFHRMLEEYPNLAALLHARISQSVQDFITKLERIQRNLDRVDGI